MGGYYRKLIVGDPSLAARYFPIAERLFWEIERFGGQRRVWHDSSGVVVIAKKDVEGQRKAIFLVTGSLLFIFTSALRDKEVGDPPTAREHLIIGGYRGSLKDEVAALDVEDLSLPASVGVEYAEFVDGKSWLFLRPSILSPAAPIAQYPVTSTGRGLNIGASVPINFPGAPFAFWRLQRGLDRDYAYTTDSAFLFTVPAKAEVYERVWSDETLQFNLLLDIKNALPTTTATSPPMNMVWPPLNGENTPSSFMITLRKNNNLYFLGYGESLIHREYCEIYKLNRAATSVAFVYQFYYAYAGGSSARYFDYFLYDMVGTMVGFSSSERRDASNNVSDLQLVHAVEDADNFAGITTPLFAFKSGDYFGYSGREESEIARFSTAWKIGNTAVIKTDSGEVNAKDIYIVEIINLAVGTSIPDGIIRRYLDEDDNEHIDVLYQAEVGYALNLAHVSSHNPEQFVVGKKVRADNTDPSVMLINAFTKNVKIITQDYSSLIGVKFVR